MIGGASCCVITPLDLDATELFELASHAPSIIEVNFGIAHIVHTDDGATNELALFDGLDAHVLELCGLTATEVTKVLANPLTNEIVDRSILQSLRLCENAVEVLVTLKSLEWGA